MKIKSIVCLWVLLYSLTAFAAEPIVRHNNEGYVTSIENVSVESVMYNVSIRNVALSELSEDERPFWGMKDEAELAADIVVKILNDWNDTHPPELRLSGTVSELGNRTQFGHIPYGEAPNAWTVRGPEKNEVWTYDDYPYGSGSGARTQWLTFTAQQDTTPPDIDLDLLKDTLWPPNHKMVKVAEISATDEVDPMPELTIEVQSNEPIDGPGDGNTDADWEFDSETGELYLRAERSGKGGGRVYTITVTATDSSGNKATKTATVTVPHDKRKGGKK